MWICKKCGARSEDSSARCTSCRASRTKPEHIKNKSLEEVWTAEQQAEWERIIKRRKKIAWVTLGVFLIVAVLLYFLVFSTFMEWPRPGWMPNIGPNLKEPKALGIGTRLLPS